MQLHGRVALLEIVELGNEPGQGQAGGRVDGQGADVVLQQLRDLLIDLLEGVEIHVAQAFAFGRQGHGAGQAVEQGEAQFLFQAGDAVAHGTGGQAQVAGRGLEAHVAGRDGEGLDIDEAGVLVEDTGDAAGTLAVLALGWRHEVSLARRGDVEKRGSFTFRGHGIRATGPGTTAQQTGREMTGTRPGKGRFYELFVIQANYIKQGPKGKFMKKGLAPEGKEDKIFQLHMKDFRGIHVRPVGSGTVTKFRRSFAQWADLVYPNRNGSGQGSPERALSPSKTWEMIYETGQNRWLGADGSDPGAGWPVPGR